MSYQQNKFQSAINHLVSNMRPASQPNTNYNPVSQPNSNRNPSDQPNSNHKPPSQPNTNYNPIDSLSIDDISYLQSYLEQVKAKKMSNMQQAKIHADPIPRNRATDLYDPLNREPQIDWQTRSKLHNTFANINLNDEIAGPRGTVSTRNKKTLQEVPSLDYVNDYYNPYECGSRQQSLGPMYNKVYTGNYDIDPALLNHLGIPKNMHQEEFPGKVRNINVESSLIQSESGRTSGQRHEREQDRFNLLPFNPQNPDNIVWKDNMPRGGYLTRSDRLEY